MFNYLINKNMLKNIKIVRLTMLVIAMFGATMATKAQAPANDDCSGAVALTVNPSTTCTTSATGTTLNATQSTAPNPSCGLAGGTNDDVWYSFVATSVSHTITLSNISGTSTDLQISTYSGTCGALTEIQCSNPVVTTVGGLTVGNTYYVRVYTNSSAAANTASFTICITTPPPPPANDDCAGAIGLTVSATPTCATPTAGTTANATPSNVAAPTCSATGIDDDVWYSFVATSAAHSVTLSSIAPTANLMSIAVYSGASCAALTSVNCIDGNTLTVSGLTIGSTYYVRVYTQSAVAGTNATFNICVATPPPPPANDECTGAIALTASATPTCATPTAGTTANATQSSQAAPTCNAAGINDDVWYSFVAISPNHTVTLLSVTPSTNTMAITVYSGASCSALTELNCVSGNTLTVTGLAIGSTYYIRVYTQSAVLSTNATFDICVSTPPPPPANDDCVGAINVPVNPTLACTNVVAGSTVSSTSSTGMPTPSCVPASGANDDVWFKFVATNPIHQISILNITGGTTDMAMTVYSGTCGALTQIACSDPESMVVFNLTVGQTYYVRVWTYTSTASTTANFNICVSTPPPPPSNDECGGAISLPVSLTPTCVTPITGTTNWATPSNVPVPTCGTTAQLNDDVWFSFVATSPFHTVTTSSATSTVYYAIYSGTCGALTELICLNNSTGSFSGLTVGQTYYIRVWTLSTTPTTFATFNICVSTPATPPVYDDPCNAIAIPVSQDGSCNLQTFTTQNATYTLGVPAPGCANYKGGDVWLKAVVPCTGKIVIDTKEVVITDGGMALYTGTCGALTLIACDDDGSVNGLMPAITASNLVPGSTVYIRVWEYGNDNPGTFGICAAAQMQTSIIPSATCGTSISFCAQSPATYTNAVGIPSSGTCGGLGSNPNPAWFTLEATNNGGFHFTISQTASGGGGVGLDVDYAMWGPFPNAATALAACPTLCSSTAISWNYSAQPVEYVNVDGVLTGQFYVLMVTNYDNLPGTITFTPGTTNPGNPGGTQGTPGPNTALSNCCTVSASANVQTVCPGATVNLSALGGPTGATWLWVGPNCWTSNLQNPSNVVVPTQPGNYVYFVSATGTGNLICSDTIQIHVLAAPNLGADTSRKVCEGTTVSLTTLYNTTGLTSGWTLNGQPVTNPAAVGVSGNYMLITANSAGCKDTAYAWVLIDTVRSVVTTTNLTCTTKGSATATPIRGISPYTYAISTAPTVFQTSNVFNNLPVGNYVITTKDSLGCTITNNIRIDSINTLTLSVRSDTLLCNGAGTALTTVSNATSYVWIPATGLSSATVQSPFATPLVSTTYTVSATLGVCTKSASVKLTVDPGITVYAGPDVTILSGDQATLNATVSTTPASVAWTPTTDIISGASSLYPTIKPAFSSGSHTYTITVVNDMGCISKDSAVIIVIPYCIKAKNAFTPNGDGINDKWEVYESYDCLKNVTVNVFNRYGSKVYENRNYSNNWDGRYEGKPVPDGTYYAVINYTLVTGRVVTIKTDVNILR